MIRIEVDGEQHEFAALPVTVGRDPDNDLPLDDNKLSRRHCRIVRSSTGFAVEDLASSNGTFVDGAPIDQHELDNGETVRIGVTDFRISWDQDMEIPRGSRRSRRGRANDVDPEELQEENRRLRRVLNLSKAVASTTDEEALLRRIVDSAIELTGAEKGFLFLVTLNGLDFRVARDRRGQDLEHPEEKISRSIAGEAVDSGRWVMTEDAGGDARFAGGRSVAYLRLRSVLCVPLKVKDGPLGAIYLENSDVTAQFREADATLVTTFCDYAALTVAASRSVVELQKREEQLRRSRERIGRLNAKLKTLLRRQSRELAGVRADLDLSRQELGLRYDTASIVAQSPEMRGVLGLVDQALVSDSPVLLRGESGTGKELLARAIHYNGARGERRFVALRCGSVPSDLFESQLFGRDGTPGLVAQAQEGTLLLQQVDRLPPELRARVREEAGSARLLASTTDTGDDHDEGLRAEFDANEIVVPALRDRRDDILPLFEHFLDSLCAEQEIDRPDVDPSLVDRLQLYPWPNNVRELRAETGRLLSLQRGVLTPSLLSPPVFSGDPSATPPSELPEGGLKELVEELEKRVIVETLKQTEGNKTRASAKLGLSRLGLRKKIERYRLDVD
ncbi:MAG: sigma 54-interacting transcriptional regulator [Planctomycetota bacterium]